MHTSFFFASIGVRTLVYALPAIQTQEACETITSVYVQPTLTKTLSTADVVTWNATTPKNQGTFIMVERVSDTTTLPETLTTTIIVCTAEGTMLPVETVTWYTTALMDSVNMEIADASGPASCTVTTTSTTLYGSTFTYVPNGQTSTFTRYTRFSQAYVTSTSSGGIDYAIATATATSSATCGPTASTQPATTTTTVTRDSRCAPSAIVSAYNNYGISWLSNHPGYPGAVYKATASDAGECCQICADAFRCSNSAWDMRTKECRLEFVVWPQGEQSCDYERSGLLAYYAYGPNHPMEPGSGWWIGTICGRAQYAGAKPDDGS